jgi:hypothetical protein
VIYIIILMCLVRWGESVMEPAGNDKFDTRETNTKHIIRVEGG